MTNKLHFKNNAAAHLFNVEITGQLSDGAWENARPLDHWKFWCNAEIIVDGEVGYEGFPMRTSYNLNSLKRYVKDRMMNAVKIAKMPWFTMEYSDVARILGDDCYLTVTPSDLVSMEEPSIKSDEWYLDHFPYSINGAVEKAAKAIGSDDPEFIGLLRAECIKQQRGHDIECARLRNEKAAKNWELLYKIGIHDLDELRAMMKQIFAAKLNVKELDTALSDISWTMNTKYAA